MPRYREIMVSFRASIRIEPSGRRTVSTDDFVAELGRHNWHWSREKANDWIENQQLYFSDITPDHSDNRLFYLFNPNGNY